MSPYSAGIDAIVAELAVASRCEVAEGPFWWDNAVWFLDINPGVLHRWDGNGHLQKWHLLERTGAVVPLQGSGNARSFLAAQQSGVYRIRLENEGIEERVCLGAPEAHLPNNRFNDGKCDAQGRFWAGTMSMKREPGMGALYCLDAGDGQVRRKIADVSLSNGLDWSPDGQTFYFIDTPTRKIDAFDYDIARGELSRRRTLTDCPVPWGFPDGMTVDAEGMLWVAFWDGGCVRRIDPATGRETAVIELPCSRATSCCFGGHALEYLYITTARGSDGACDAEPLAGNLFVASVGTRGNPCHRFRPSAPVLK